MGDISPGEDFPSGSENDVEAVSFETSSQKFKKPIASAGWCITQSKVLDFEYYWIIRDYSMRPTHESFCFESCVFAPNANDKIEWCLKLLPNGVHGNNKDYIGMQLMLVSCHKSEIRVRYSFGILNDKQEIIRGRECSSLQNFKPGTCRGFKKFVRKDFLFDPANELLVNDELSLVCEISIVDDYINISGQYKSHLTPVGGSLSSDFRTLLDELKFTDITICVERKEFKAHKAILAARSTEFARIIESFKEGDTVSFLEIKDVTHEVFQEILMYIYTDTSPKLDILADEILGAADRFELLRLKALCEEALFKQLTIDDAAEIFMLAHTHSAKQLKSFTLSYMKVYASHVVRTPGWEYLTKYHSDILPRGVYKFIEPKRMRVGTRTGLRSRKRKST